MPVLYPRQKVLRLATATVLSNQLTIQAKGKKRPGHQVQLSVFLVIRKTRLLLSWPKSVSKVCLGEKWAAAKHWLILSQKARVQADWCNLLLVVAKPNRSHS